jgi:small subunit ribosomal protein S12
MKFFSLKKLTLFSMFKRFILRPPKLFFLQKKQQPYELRKFRKSLKLARILYQNPQKRIIIKKIRITTPRKPNSARRKTVKGIYKFGKTVQAYIPGGKHQLKQYSQALVHGNGARDLPGIYVNAIRGKLDLKPVVGKIKRRSLYGVRKTTNNPKC